MPLARIRSQSREAALELSEQLYELGYTVETISPGEYREVGADLEIDLETCAPEQLDSVLQKVEGYEAVYLGESVVELLPLTTRIADNPPAEEVVAPALAGIIEKQETSVASLSNAAAEEESPAAVYVKQNRASQRTKKWAELVARMSTRLGELGSSALDLLDETRSRCKVMFVESSKAVAQQSSRARLTLTNRIRAAKAQAAARMAESQRQTLAKIEALRAERELEREQRKRAVSTERTRPVPVRPRAARVASGHSSGWWSKARDKERRGSPAMALKLGAAAGLSGMMLVIGYANRKPASPLGLGELTRSTTVTQSAPFGSAEVKSPAVIVPAAVQSPMTASADLRKIPAPTPKSKLSPAPKRTPAYTDDEPEVVVRHFNTQRSTRAANTPKGDGVKRFSDLD